MRKSEVTRTTLETDISLKLELDGTGESEISTGCGFFDHMLTLFAKHGRFNLYISCKGDTQVDYHHTVEDVGICLGEAFSNALGDMRGVMRYGNMILPMDEALILCAVDLSGRGYLSYGLELPTSKCGNFDTELGKEFWLAFMRKANMTLHMRQLAGENSHHILEASFKCMARALKQAVCIDEKFAGEIPSTKGVL